MDVYNIILCSSLAILFIVGLAVAIYFNLIRDPNSKDNIVGFKVSIDEDGNSKVEWRTAYRFKRWTDESSYNRSIHCFMQDSAPWKRQQKYVDMIAFRILQKEGSENADGSVKLVNKKTIGRFWFGELVKDVTYIVESSYLPTKSSLGKFSSEYKEGIELGTIEVLKDRPRELSLVDQIVNSPQI